MTQKKSWLVGIVLCCLLATLLLGACGQGATPTAVPPIVAPTETGIPEPTAVNQPNTPGAAASASAAPATVVTPATPVPPAAPVPTATTRPVSTSPLATHRLVTYYGHPNDKRMGILGESDPNTMIQKLKQQAQAYTAADSTRPALCTIELIASVAQGSPGPEGLYIARTADKDIERYAQLAESNGCLLMLDIQMGYDTIQNDIKPLLPYLARPYVHLAIDPEFHVKPGQIPGEHYGSVSAAEVAWAQQTLGDLVRSQNLPDKVIVLHQFRDDMLPDKAQIKVMPNVDLVVMMDGWGDPGSKVANYAEFIHDELIQYGGIKLFYRQDAPLLTPPEVIKLDPTPLVIIYQ